MIKYLQKIISLRNLKDFYSLLTTHYSLLTTVRRTSGQIATLLTLIMVVILAVVLITINIGSTSVTATNLANAADSGVLKLASQLSSKAYNLFETNDKEIELCYKGGMMDDIGGALFPAVFFAVAPLVFPPDVVAVLGNGPVLSAIGGMLGAKLQGTDLRKGVLEVATTAAAVGLAACTGALQGGVWGGVISAVLATASRFYSRYAREEMKIDAAKALADSINGLSERAQYREGAFFDVLGSTVDDPNKTPDVNDSDDDNDTTEEVPYFQYWWDLRLAKLKEITAQFYRLTKEYFENSSATYSKGLLDYKSYFKDTALKTYLFRVGADEEDVIITTEATPNGLLIDFFSKLTDAGYPLSFWRPGPDKDEIGSGTCKKGSCGKLDSFDEVDYSINRLKKFNTMVGSLKNQGYGNLARTWTSWMDYFYNEEGKVSFYDSFNRIIEGNPSAGDGEFKKGIKDWMSRVEAIKEKLPVCEYTCGMMPWPWAGSGAAPWGEDDGVCPADMGAKITNAPCRNTSGKDPWGTGSAYDTVDDDPEDEFTSAGNAMQEMIDNMQSFRTDAVNFYNKMKLVNDTGVTGGLNPVNYSWTDARGSHSVNVEVSAFKIPYLDESTSGSPLMSETCFELKDYSDNGDTTWVKIIRSDPTNKAVGLSGILGKWNPFSGTITRQSFARWSHDAKPGIERVK